MRYDDIRGTWWDDPDEDDMPELPTGGYFNACCPEWDTTHVAPVFKKGELIHWECPHCGSAHHADELNQWNDIPF